MSDPVFKLPRPPIVEAVLDIDCDLPPGLQLSALEEDAKHCFSEAYPTFQIQHFQVHQIAVSMGQPPDVSVQDSVGVLQFLKEDGLQLIQLRREGYSFNRLAPYGSFDDYLPEVKKTWNQYVLMAKPVSVRAIRLRYINRILVPLKDNQVELEDYFHIAPKFPLEGGFGSLSLLNQHTAVEIATGHQINFVFTTELIVANKLPVIFDNTVICGEKGEPGDWPWISNKIQALRDLKNRIFEKVVTEKCLELFQ